jgi:uncharacterized hydrophobic protein (TIGR00271 family)
VSENPRLKDRVSSRIEPFWLNPATVKGTIAIGVGLFILAAPEASAFVIRLVLGAALIVSGASGLWFTIRHRTRRGMRSAVEAGFSLAAGVLLLLIPSQTLRVVVLIGAGYLAIRGVGVLIAANSLRRRGQVWVVDLVRGLFYISIAVAVVVLPVAVVSGLRLVLAAGAVVLGAIMLVYGLRERSDDEVVDIDVASVTELINDWLLERDVGGERREKVGDGLFFEGDARGSKLSAWWVMLLLSVAIATFGIIQDSTAVVIGAMLIAPLMTPILGTAAGIVNTWIKRIAASFGLVAAGAGAAVGLAIVIGQWVPIIVPLAGNSQVTSRVSPNIVDMLIALAAGAAGAYANVDDRVSDSIAGVAIAVALVPPLGVVGLTLQAGMFEDAFGALLLFLTNLVSIILAATVVFFLTGYAPYRSLQENRARVFSLIRTVALAAIIIMIPLAITAEDVLSRSARLRIANDAVAEWLDGSSLAAQRIQVSGTDVGVFVTGPGVVPDLAELETNLAEGFGAPVAITVEHAPTSVFTYQSDAPTE